MEIIRFSEFQIDTLKKLFKQESPILNLGLIVDTGEMIVEFVQMFPNLKGTTISPETLKVPFYEP